MFAADPFTPMDSDDIEAEQDRIFQEWRMKEVRLDPSRLADASERAGALRWLIIKQAQSLLSNPLVVMPPDVRAELETLIRAERAVKAEAA